MKFLADQNVRYPAVIALRRLGYDIIHTSEIGMSKTADQEIINKCIQEDRILITFDEGFGDDMTTPLPPHHPGVIRLKLQPQKWDWVANRLDQFLSTTNDAEMKDTLVILYNHRVRLC